MVQDKNIFLFDRNEEQIDTGQTHDMSHPPNFIRLFDLRKRFLYETGAQYTYERAQRHQTVPLYHLSGATIFDFNSLKTTHGAGTAFITMNYRQFNRFILSIFQDIHSGKANHCTICSASFKYRHTLNAHHRGKQFCFYDKLGIQ